MRIQCVPGPFSSPQRAWVRGYPFLLLFCSSKVVLTRLEEPFVFFSNQLGICGLRVQRQLHMEVSQLHYNSRLYTKMASGFVRVTSRENVLSVPCFTMGKCKTWTLDWTGLDWTGLWTGPWTEIWTGFWTDTQFNDDHFQP